MMYPGANYVCAKFQSDLIPNFATSQGASVKYKSTISEVNDES